MVKTISIQTKSRMELQDITARVEDVVRAAKVKNGICHIFIPHTTAAVTINENADPSVQRDIVNWLNENVPFDADYGHSEGNASAHIKSTIVGIDREVFIEEGRLKLGAWQGIFFCEFDGPRRRNVYVKIVED
ncbi:MAG: hypothetical protein A2987_04685 [Omnitrophica bacterium RIFCSPLOWO2_01_FULL_45_10]|nr:MAG: hypothetical protein A2987_04685 [Omnitrophica bacterium RIFCSPLOWO2_01_FULL_45_10]